MKSWKEAILQHNKDAKSRRKSFKRVVFIYERILNEIIQHAKIYHPREISIEMLFNGKVSDNIFKDYKPAGLFNEWPWQYKILGKIINVAKGDIFSVKSLPVTREDHFGYYTTPYPNFDAQLHTHTIEDAYELSDADIQKSKHMSGPSFLLVYPYTIDNLIGWNYDGYALNIVIVDNDGNVI